MNNPAQDPTPEGHIRFKGLPYSHDNSPPANTRFKFVTEMFFITQRALHVGLMPAENVFATTASDLYKQTQGDMANNRVKQFATVRGREGEEVGGRKVGGRKVGGRRSV